MKVALCVIGRMENRYAVEFIEHYKGLSFDKIFVYDNNFGDEEHFEEVLQSYVNDGFVEVVNFRDIDVGQLKAYTDCYVKHNKEYDWIAFFDFDEYLTFVQGCSIKEFLSNDVFNAYKCIHVNWMDYGDNDLVYYEDKPLKERFIKPLPFNLCLSYDFPENYHIKSIVRGGIDNFKWNSNPHTPSMGLPCCDGNGNACGDSPFNKFDYSTCYIRHYFTKTIDEWLNIKCKRQCPDRPRWINDINEDIKKFFKLNNVTEDKIKYLNEHVK